jgi:ankyrin repeat protein
VDDVTVKALAAAVRAGDIRTARAMLEARPELVHFDMAGNDEHRALHYAVLDRAPELVRLLMAHGADARKGIYPHRDATSALAIAVDRGYAEIVSIIDEEEQRRRQQAGVADSAVPATEDRESAARAAVIRGDADWLRHRHADGALVQPTVVNIFEPATGLLTLAVQHDRPEVLTLLLDLGCDPDERVRVSALDPPEYSWGAPLWHCAAAGRLAMAELLLQRGADPNAKVYASGSPVYSAYRNHDEAMTVLLQRYGGATDAITAAMHGRTELAAKMLAGEIDGRLEDGMFAGQTVAEQLLWGAADGGHREIVRMALARVDWLCDDPRWYRILWRPLPGHTARPDFQRYLECLRLILERGDANAPGSFGRTLLHDLAARGDADEQFAFATLLLDAGAKVDVRDDLLKSTPLGWACRWGRVELVRLLLDRGADPVEADAEPWAAPRAWAEAKKQAAVIALLR